MKILNTYNQQYCYTSFGSEIKSNSYLQDSILHIANSGTQEEQGLLAKYMGLIEKDNSMLTFEMTPEINLAGATAKYYFNINNGESRLSSGDPVNNPWLRRGKPDPYFLQQLGWFVRDHYGITTYQQAVKTASKYRPKYVHDATCALVRKYCPKG